MTNIDSPDADAKSAPTQSLDQLLLSALDDLYISIELHIPLRLRPLGLQFRLARTAEVLQSVNGSLPAKELRVSI